MMPIRFDPGVAEQILTFARLLTARGYVHNQLGNVAIRAPHPEHEHGVIYTKHAGVSLEEATADNIVVTDVPTDALLHGRVPTSIGHQLNREILRLRPDVGAVIHVHLDEMIALFASRAVKELRVLRSEERRVGKECRCGWARDHGRKKVQSIAAHECGTKHPCM